LHSLIPLQLLDLSHFGVIRSGCYTRHCEPRLEGGHDIVLGDKKGTWGWGCWLGGWLVVGEVNSGAVRDLKGR